MFLRNKNVIITTLPNLDGCPNQPLNMANWCEVVELDYSQYYRLYPDFTYKTPNCLVDPLISKALSQEFAGDKKSS